MIFSLDEYADCLLTMLLLGWLAAWTAPWARRVRRCHHQKKKSTEPTTTTAISEPTIAPTGEWEWPSLTPLDATHTASWQRSHVCVKKTHSWSSSHFGHSLASSGHRTHWLVLLDSGGDAVCLGPAVVRSPAESSVSDG